MDSSRDPFVVPADDLVVEGGRADEFDGFAEPAGKTGPDVTERCGPEGIDPGDERYIGGPVSVDFETGAVTALPAED